VADRLRRQALALRVLHHHILNNPNHPHRSRHLYTGLSASDTFTAASKALHGITIAVQY
jgi:hypothetical protein